MLLEEGDDKEAAESMIDEADQFQCFSIIYQSGGKSTAGTENPLLKQSCDLMTDDADVYREWVDELRQIVDQLIYAKRAQYSVHSR